MKIKIENCDIAQENVTKLLGVVINKNLTWMDHINAISNKIRKNIGVICKLSKSLPVDVLHTLYNTLISPYLQDCNEAWATNKTTFLEKLFRIQKKAIRDITRSIWNTHSETLFKETGIMKLVDLSTFQVACFVYQEINKKLPTVFNNYFFKNADIHRHNTKHCLNIHQIRCKTNIRASCIKIFGAKVWNSIP